jgi:hypothetical protein
MNQATELTLPISGKTATIRRPTGRDIIQAERLAGSDAGPLTLQVAILSRVASIDGRTLPFEDFQDLDMEDIQAMLKVDFTKGPPPGPPATSQAQS